jgi:hypothetical protein
MNWRGRGWKRSWPNLRCYPDIFKEGLRKNTKNFSHYNRYQGRDRNPGPHEYEGGLLTTRPRRSVRTINVTVLESFVIAFVMLYVSDSTTGRSGFDPRQGQRIFPLTSVSRPAVRPTRPPVQWVPGVLSPGKRAAGAWRWPLTPSSAEVRNE